MPVRFCLCFFLVVLLLPAQSGRGGRGIGGSPATPGQSQAPPPPADCAASGTVVNAMTGEPIPHAMVGLSGGDGAGAATDATGKWSIANTTCGTRRVIASHPGFISDNMIQGPHRPTNVQLVSGSPVTSQKISLMPEASLTGKVQDTDGEPLQATVQIFRVSLQEGKRVLNGGGASATDAQGNFRIGGLTGGRYIVCATSRQTTYPVGGGAPLIYGENCFPGPLAAGPATAMPIEAGREVRTAFTLTPIRGAHVRGSIQGAPAWAPGQPRVNVQLVRSDGVAGGAGVNSQMGPDGDRMTFDFAGVAPGAYVLRAVLPGSPQAGGSGNTATQAVEVGDSDVNDVAVAMQAPGSLTGMVRFELSNPATAASPVVEVNLTPAMTGPNFAGPVPRAQWDASHVNFDFAGVPAAQFQLNTYANAQGVYIKSASLRGQDVLNQPFAVNGTTGPIEVVVSDDTGGLDVTTNDADGHPVTAAVILVSASGTRRFLNSGDDGHAGQKSFPVGEYKAWAFEDQNVPYAEDEWMAQNAGPGEKVTVTSGGSASVTLKRITVAAE